MHDEKHDADACALCHERLPDYAADYLRGDERLSVERHLRTCARCSTELREWEAIKQVVRAMYGVPSPQRPFADTWSELRAQLSLADSTHDRSHNGRVHMDKITPSRTDQSLTHYNVASPPRKRVDEPRSKRRYLGVRLRGFAAAAAMVATVAALIAVFINLAPGHGSGTSVGTGGTNNERGHWVNLTALDYNPAFDANDVPAIAPTNPSVVYETQAANEQTHTAATMRRTDDGGKTWQALPLPVAADHVGHLGVAASPLNARTVFLRVFDDNAGDCPANRTKQYPDLAGWVFCWLQYTSVDGGQHWMTTNLPLANGTQAGILTATNSTSGLSGIFAASLHTMGGRLYAGFTCVISSCTRLVTSADRGLTWQFADEQIVPQGGSTCDYAASVDGATLFAVTAKNCGDFRVAATQPTLWRSADAGAHWTPAGTLPTPNARGMFLTKDTASGKQLLYAALPRTIGTSTDKMGGKYFTFSADSTDLKVSADGGETWESAPSAGIPAGMQAANYGTGMVGMLGTLHDGSVVVEFIAGSAQDPFAGGTLFAWKRGETKWRQIAPPLTQEIGSMLAIPAKDASQQDTLYLVMVNRGGMIGGVDDTSDTFKFMRFVP